MTKRPLTHARRVTVVVIIVGVATSLFLWLLGADADFVFLPLGVVGIIGGALGLHDVRAMRDTER